MTKLCDNQIVEATIAYDSFSGIVHRDAEPLKDPDTKTTGYCPIYEEASRTKTLGELP